MNWDVAIAVSEIIGAAAVVVTLIYLAVQVRQNTNALKATSYRSAKTEFNHVNMAIAQSNELPQILDKAFVSMEQLAPDERIRAGLMWLSYTNIWETLFHEMRDSVGHDEFWKAEERTIKEILTMPGYREWWKENSYGGTADFRDHIDQLLVATESLK